MACLFSDLADTDADNTLLHGVLVWLDCANRPAGHKQLVKTKSHVVAAYRLVGHKQLVRTKSHAAACFIISMANSQPKGQALCQLMVGKEPRAGLSVTLCVGETHLCAEEAHSDATFMGGSVQWPFSRRSEGEFTGALGACCIGRGC
jgi:hypothetical protein